MDSIISITKDGKYAGHLICIDDEVYTKGFCGGIESLVNDGCTMQVTAVGSEAIFKALTPDVETEGYCSVGKEAA